VSRLVIGLVLFAGLSASPAAAQVFLASEPHPRFTIGLLFVVVAIRLDLTSIANVSFSPTVRANVSPPDLRRRSVPVVAGRGHGSERARRRGSGARTRARAPALRHAVDGRLSL
jgi:hypothetical protein